MNATVSKNLVKNIKSYNPARIPDAVLGDDWRIVSAWYATIMEGKELKHTQEEVIETAEKIIQEMIKRGKVTFNWREESPAARELLRGYLEKNTKGGIYLIPPYGELLAAGAKTAIVKTQPYDFPAFYYLLSGDNSFGFLRLCPGKEESLEKYQERFSEHKITKDDRLKWGKTIPAWLTGPFWFYRVREFIPFDKPKSINKDKGIQVTVRETEMRLGSFDPSRFTPELIGKMTSLQLIEARAALNALYEKKIEAGAPKDEALVNLAVFILEEFARRRLDFRVESPLDREATRWSQAKALDAKIYLSDLLPHFGDFMLKRPYVYLVGSSTVEGRGNDVDLIIREGERNIPLEYRICKQLPPELRGRVHFIYNVDGPFTNHIPLFNQKVELEARQEVISMQRTTSQEPAREAAASLRENKIKHFRFFKLPKATESVVLDGVKEDQYPLVVDEMHDGMRATLDREGDRVLIRSEDGDSIPNERFPQLVESLKKLPGNFILDSMITGKDSKTGKHLGRSDVAGYAHQKGAGDDRNYQANVFTVLLRDGEDLHEKSEIERKKILDSLKQEIPGITFAPWKLASGPKELQEAIEHFRDPKTFPGTEGAMIKLSMAEYPLTGNALEWFKLKNERGIDAEVVVDLQERRKKALPNNPEWDALVREWAGRTPEQLQEMPGERLPIGFFAMENHIRPGKAGPGAASVHGDFRFRSKPTHGEGFTISWQQPEAWPDIRTMEEADKISNTFDDGRYYKWGPSHPPTEHAFSLEKGPQPIEWLAFGLRAKVIPGEVGATREGPGLFRGVAWGMLRRGKQTPDYREFFLYDLNHYKGGKRVIFRLLPTGSYERVGDEGFHWESWHSEDGFAPSFLGRHERMQKESLPVDDESGIPPEWEMVISRDLQWWGKKKTDMERLELMDQAYNQLIADGYLAARPLDGDPLPGKLPENP